MSNESHFIEFSRPFITAAKNVFETMVFTKLETQKPSLKQNNISRGEVSSVLGLSGEVTKPNGKTKYRSMLVLSWPMETYLKVAGAMLMDTYTEYCDDIADVGGEICNMIMGNTKRELAGIGYTTNMAIPSMITGKDHSINYPKGTAVIIIPIETAHGKMFMEVCYAEDKSE